jgi:transposase
MPEAAKSWGIAANMLYRLKQSIEDQKQGLVMSEDERDELKRLHKENKNYGWRKIY